MLRFLSFAVIAVIVGLISASAATAQQVTTSDSSSRPTVLPMTPGSKLNTSRESPQIDSAGKKSRVITVPTGSGNTPARALKSSPNDYSFCNQTSYVLLVAVGLKNGPVVWTRGWWPIHSGECKVVIKGPLAKSTYYSFARSSYAHQGSLRTWGGTHQLCTGKVNFQASGSEGAPCGPGHFTQGFAAVDVQGKAGWLTSLSEGNSLKSLDEARTAGLQRLLSDVGFFDGAIDGVAGPKFHEAISQARTALSLSSSDTGALYSKLLAEATRIQSASGLTFCNRTQEIIWAAFGRDVPGKTQSRGWYRLLPEQCEKVIKERLSEPAIFAFASVDKTDAGVAETWGGTKVFCTKDNSFDFDDSTNCVGKGFASTGFFQINTNGQPSVTFEFVPRSPSAEAQ